MCDQNDIDQPKWANLKSAEDAFNFADKGGYPVLVRPSYVLSGAAMNVAHTPGELSLCLDAAAMGAAVRGEISILGRQIVEVKQEFGVSAFEPMLAGAPPAGSGGFGTKSSWQASVKSAPSSSRSSSGVKLKLTVILERTIETNPIKNIIGDTCAV